MSRIYAVPYNGTLGTGGTIDLLYVSPASNKPVKLRGFQLSQGTNQGDANEKDIRITVRRFTATVTVGSGGSAITAAAPLDDASGTTWSGTIRCGDSTVATTTGTNQVTDDFYWNERATPFEKWYPDVPFCEKARNTEAIIVRSETTLSGSTTFSGIFWIEEE
jgi:hypothetical protein